MEIHHLQQKYPSIPFQTLHIRNRNINVRGILRNIVVEYYGRAINFTSVIYVTSAWRCEGLACKANDVTRSRTLTMSATFRQNNAWCHKIKSKQKFCTLLVCRPAVNITKLVQAFRKLIIAHQFKKFTSFYTARVSVIHFI